VINWKENDHRRNPGRHPEPERPTPREIRALQAAEDGSSLAVAGARIGLSAAAIGSILSHAYDRLKITKRWTQHLSQERRALAIKICKRNGWWPE
jgi:DNA-binding NarL/FixJ family response regulator